MARLSNNTNIPTAVSNLRLCSALSNCGCIGVQRAMVISIDEKLYVYDDATLDILTGQYSSTQYFGDFLC